MKPQMSYLSILLSTPLWMVLTAETTFGFSITGSRDSFPDSYQNPQGSGTVSTYKIQELTPPDNSSEFIQVFQREFSNWNFNNQATNILEGQFNISAYYPCVSLNICGFETGESSPHGGVGASLTLTYIPSGNDPLPSASFTENKVQWIQWVKSQKKIGDEYQEDVNKIDITMFLPTHPGAPYYFGKGSSGNSYFTDQPRRSDLEEHKWYAQLYLVKETAPNTVTIYNGISWGWENTFTPNTGGGGGGNCTGGSGGGGCDNSFLNASAPDIPLFDSNNNSNVPKSVPEPPSILGLLTLGTWAAIQISKIIKNHRP